MIHLIFPWIFDKDGFKSCIGDIQIKKPDKNKNNHFRFYNPNVPTDISNPSYAIKLMKNEKFDFQMGY